MYNVCSSKILLLWRWFGERISLFVIVDQRQLDSHVCGQLAVTYSSKRLRIPWKTYFSRLVFFYNELYVAQKWLFMLLMFFEIDHLNFNHVWIWRKKSVFHVNFCFICIKNKCCHHHILQLPENFILVFKIGSIYVYLNIKLFPKSMYQEELWPFENRQKTSFKIFLRVGSLSWLLWQEFRILSQTFILQMKVLMLLI